MLRQRSQQQGFGSGGLGAKLRFDASLHVVLEIKEFTRGA